MSTKKYYFHGPDGLKYFLIISLLLHGALMWSAYFLGPRMGLLSARTKDLEKPEYVQVVELPPGYKVPDTGLKPPKKPVRYAANTNVVKKEEIPGGPDVNVMIRPLSGARGSKRVMPPRAARRRGAAAKKVAGVSKPRRIFKTEKGSAGGGGKKGEREREAEKSAAKTGVRAAEEKEVPAQRSPARGEVALKGMEEKIPAHEARERRERHEKPENTEKVLKETRLASEGKGSGPGKGGRTVKNPGGGHSGSRGGVAPLKARPNLLLSDTRVAELARRYRGSGHHSKSKTLMLNTSELKYQKYLIDLRHKIEQYWEYPRTAVERGWQGKLFIDFTVKKDGAIGDIRISRSSRYPVLDDAAITALKLAAPFATFPGNFDVDEIKIHGQFVYNLIGMPRQ